MEKKDKTDCFAYEMVPLKGKGSRARCGILTEVVCRNETCNWYETVPEHEERMKKAKRS